VRSSFATTIHTGGNETRCLSLHFAAMKGWSSACKPFRMTAIFSRMNGHHEPVGCSALAPPLPEEKRRSAVKAWPGCPAPAGAAYRGCAV